MSSEIMEHNFLFTPPFKFPPTGGNGSYTFSCAKLFFVPSPLGEGQDGGLNKFTMKSWYFYRSCYI